eukprot:CAMPEP_0169248072 /NCGR_PEP_ID=MMETSP1016-20121227/35641_1 /TAXON_ID=342587 /ORGANISM="Karlodinium micrum, Strain CCMP2283" /LENGTH=255 /DNA_ID=CAMNT_0009328831 /DNA_START=61 /DNA_END=826 /DNA_ORIENTATION=-
MVLVVRAFACFYLASQASSIAHKGNVSISAKSGGYSTNAICRQYNCINPVVPALLDLRALSETTWQCQGAAESRQYMDFCKGAVLYDVGVPSPNKSTSLDKIVLAQDSAAATAYFYHLAGMNLEPWVHKEPWNSDDKCVRSIYMTVCHTYFPRAQAGCKSGEATPYLRPCQNVCSNYVKHCAVECCDESVQCVFKKSVALVDGSTATIEGYHEELGPSAQCTGAAIFQTPALAMLLALFSCVAEIVRIIARKVWQ